MLSLKIESITVIGTSGTDLLILTCPDYVEGVYPFKNNLQLKIDVAKGQGETYAKEILKCENVKVVNGI